MDDSCPICYNPFNDPKCLPCGHKFCGECIQVYNKRADDKSFKCPVCRTEIKPEDPERSKETMDEDCSICLQTFTDPKGLPCFHTFCRECLQMYINQEAGDRSFNCPLCRREIQPTEHGKPKTEWAGLFPKNRYVQHTKEKPVPAPKPIPAKPAAPKPVAQNLVEPQPLKLKTTITLKRDLSAGINDMIMLDDQRFIMADPCDKRIWVFSNSGDILRDVPLDNVPFSMCLLQGSFLAVSLPSDKKILILDYENLTIKDTLSFGKSYSGLGSDDRNRIYASYHDEYIFVDVISRINPQSSYEISHVIKLPCFFFGIYRLRVLPSGHVLIINYENAWKLFCFDQNGEEFFSYDGDADNKFKSTSDVAVGPNFIYVANKTTKTFHRIAHQGDPVDIPLTAHEVSYEPNKIYVNRKGELAMFHKGKQNYKIQIFSS